MFQQWFPVSSGNKIKGEMVLLLLFIYLFIFFLGGGGEYGNEKESLKTGNYIMLLILWDLV